MNKAVIGGIAAMAVLGYLAATPYLTVHQMKSAADDRDSEALSEYIEFPSVRQSMKDQFNAVVMQSMASDQSMAGNPFAAMGAAFAGAIVDRMVDAFVTPAGITAMMSGEMPGKGGANEQAPTEPTDKPFDRASIDYESISKFAVEVQGDDGKEVRFIFRRRGIVDWKLTEILFPMDRI